jgi:hypothetical protein
MTPGEVSTGLAKVLPSLAREVALIENNTSDLRNVSLQRLCYSSMERLTLASHLEEGKMKSEAWLGAATGVEKALGCRIHLVISYHASELGYLDLVDIPI